MKNKISRLEAEKLCKEQGFTLDTLQQMFEIMPKPKSFTFTVEKERQFAIKILNVISNLKQKERDRVLLRAIKLNKL